MKNGDHHAWEVRPPNTGKILVCRQCTQWKRTNSDIPLSCVQIAHPLPVLVRVESVPRFDVHRSGAWDETRTRQHDGLGTTAGISCPSWSDSPECGTPLSLAARDERRLLRLQKQKAAVKLLIIDELGFVPLSKTGAELLFESISQRHERGATLITSSLPFDEWTEVFGSERLTGAFLDRLTHHVNILEMNGES